MQATRQRDTHCELAIRRLLHAAGFRYRTDYPVLGRRRADLAFTRTRVAVFVDGCFWHGCPQHRTWPKNNAEWWRRKLDANVDRDRDTDQRLRDLGWRVIRVWEHEDPADAAKRIEAVLLEAGAGLDQPR